MSASGITPGEPHLTLVDGRSGHCVHLLDRGFQYGDGLFETILIRQGQPCLWGAHLARLCSGAERLGIPLPDPDLLLAESRLVADGLDEGVLKLVLTRGSGGRGYRPPVTPRTRRILSSFAATAEAGERWREGVVVRYCHTPASVNPALAGLKHLNRLDSVLARREWDTPAIAEGLMFDDAGTIVGGTMTNLFLWDGTRLHTPPVDRCGIAGTVRALTMALAAVAGVGVVERRLERADLAPARGLFLTNAVVGVWPVRALEDRRFALDRLPWSLLDAVRQAAQTPG